MAGANISDYQADPDHDGINNLLEYGFGFDPQKAHVSGLPASGFATEGGNTYLTLSYNQVKAANGYYLRSASFGRAGDLERRQRQHATGAQHRPGTYAAGNGVRCHADLGGDAPAFHAFAGDPPIGGGASRTSNQGKNKR